MSRSIKSTKVSHAQLLKARRVPMPRPTEIVEGAKVKRKRKRAPRIDPHDGMLSNFDYDLGDSLSL